jgi:hypothetical protein
MPLKNNQLKNMSNIIEATEIKLQYHQPAVCGIENQKYDVEFYESEEHDLASINLLYATLLYNKTFLRICLNDHVSKCKTFILLHFTVTRQSQFLSQFLTKNFSYFRQKFTKNYDYLTKLHIWRL